jgi:hypothetical protein
VKFRDLPVGTTFRFFRRGLLLTKTSASTYASEQAGMRQSADPDADVLPEDDVAIAQPRTADPYGDTNKVDVQKGWVRLDGVFTADQLEAILTELKKQKKS